MTTLALFAQGIECSHAAPASPSSEAVSHQARPAPLHPAFFGANLDSPEAGEVWDAWASHEALLEPTWEPSSPNAWQSLRAQDLEAALAVTTAETPRVLALALAQTPDLQTDDALELAWDVAFAQACGQLALAWRADRARQGLAPLPYTPDRPRIYSLARKLLRDHLPHEPA